MGTASVLWTCFLYATLCLPATPYVILIVDVHMCAEQATCESRCKDEVEAIIARCKAAGIKYTDPDFNADTQEGINNMLYVTGKEGCYDWSDTADTKNWRRLSDLHSDAVLFDDGVACGDIAQGSIGTCSLPYPTSIRTRTRTRTHTHTHTCHHHHHLPSLWRSTQQQGATRF